jgi:hypothetical protein
MNYSAEYLLEAYGDHMKPKLRMFQHRHGRRYGDFDVKAAAWIRVVTTRGYRRSEHWLRAKYLFHRDLGVSENRRVQRFISLLAHSLEKDPFNPEVLSEVKTRANFRLALLSSRDACTFSGKSIRTIQRWCNDGKLSHVWRWKRLYVRLGDLMDLMDPGSEKRGKEVKKKDDKKKVA